MLLINYNCKTSCGMIRYEIYSQAGSLPICPFLICSSCRSLSSSYFSQEQCLKGGHISLRKTTLMLSKVTYFQGGSGQCSLTITSTEAPVKSVRTDVLHIAVSSSMKERTFVFMVSILLRHALLFHRIGTVYWWVLDSLNTYETHLENKGKKGVQNLGQSFENEFAICLLRDYRQLRSLANHRLTWTLISMAVWTQNLVCNSINTYLFVPHRLHEHELNSPVLRRVFLKDD